MAILETVIGNAKRYIHYTTNFTSRHNGTSVQFMLVFFSAEQSQQVVGIAGVKHVLSLKC